MAFQNRNFTVKGFKTISDDHGLDEFNYFEEYLTKKEALQIGSEIAKKYLLVQAIKYSFFKGSMSSKIVKQWKNPSPTVFCIIAFKNKEDQQVGEFKMMEDDIESITKAMKNARFAFKSKRFAVVTVRQGNISGTEIARFEQ